MGKTYSQSITDPVFLLVDNGSLKPASTLNLRRIASALAERTGKAVRPVSLLHSSAIDPELLEGVPAEIFEPAIRRMAEGGVRRVAVLPLFFGPSRALTEYIPERLTALKERFADLEATVAKPLVDTEDGSDRIIAQILCHGVRKTIREQKLRKPRVALVDHGSPVKAVTDVRDLLARRMRENLASEVSIVAAASMERREGAGYDFNEPLLERLLEREDFREGEVVVSLLFLSPGRHAGDGGDIEQICRAAEARHPGLRTCRTDFVGEDLRIVDILEKRLMPPG